MRVVAAVAVGCSFSFAVVVIGLRGVCVLPPHLHCLQMLNQRLAKVLSFIDFVDESDGSGAAAASTTTMVGYTDASSSLFDPRYVGWC